MTSGSAALGDPAEDNQDGSSSAVEADSGNPFKNRQPQSTPAASLLRAFLFNLHL